MVADRALSNKKNRENLITTLSFFITSHKYINLNGAGSGEGLFPVPSSFATDPGYPIVHIPCAQPHSYYFQIIIFVCYG